jgi:hypothetical protein
VQKSKTIFAGSPAGSASIRDTRDRAPGNHDALLTEDFRELAIRERLLVIFRADEP